MYLTITLFLVLLIDIYLMVKFFIQRNFNVKIFILTYFLFGSSIIALLTGIFFIGGILGLIPILLYMAFNFNNLTKYFFKAPFKIKFYFGFIFFLFLFEMVWTILSDTILFAIEKNIMFVLYILVSVYTLLIFRTTKDFYKFIVYSHFWITLYLFMIVINLNLDSNMYLLTNGYAGGENRIVMSRYLFIYIIGSIYLISKNYLYIVSLFPAIYIYIFSAARGPLVGLIIALLFYVIVNIRRIMKQKIFYFSLLLIVSGTIMLLSIIDLNQLSDQFVLAKRLLQSENLANTQRGHLLQVVYHHFLNIDVFDFFFGYGAADSHNYIHYKYPHNFIIELYFELGLIGLTLAVFFVYFNLSIYKNIYKDSLLFTLVIMQGILFFSSMFSGSLHTMSHLLIFTAIVYKLFEIQGKENEYTYR